MNFITKTDTSVGFFTIILVLGVIFVNGFTDAPNSISGVISSKIWSKSKACILSGTFNFLGVITSAIVGTRVADHLLSLIDFGKYSIYGVWATLITVIIFGIGAWAFAMPSSESHALISSVFGASLAIGVRNTFGFGLIVTAMTLSSLSALAFSLILGKILQKSGDTCVKYEKLASLGSSFMHGAQDGQKFMALLLLTNQFSNAEGKVSMLLIALLVGGFMLLGTWAGGGRIIDSLGNDIVKNTEKIAFLSDFSTTVCVFICSILGFSVSTGNIKACSLIGAGLGENEKINKETVIKIIFTSVITFPICIGLGFVFASLLIRLY